MYLAAWMSETAVVMNVSAKEARRSCNDRHFKTVVELDEKNGGGYMGSLEIFHQLHCLVWRQQLAEKILMVANLH